MLAAATSASAQHTRRAKVGAPAIPRVGVCTFTYTLHHSTAHVHTYTTAAHARAPPPARRRPALWAAAYAAATARGQCAMQLSMHALYAVGGESGHCAMHDACEPPGHGGGGGGAPGPYVDPISP